MDEQLKNLIAQLKAAGVDTRAFQKAFDDTSRTIGDSEKLLQTMLSTLRGVQANARGLSGEFGDIRDNLAAALAELTKKNAAVNKAVRSYRGLTGIVEQLAQEEEGVITLGTKQLDVLKSKSSIYLQEMQLNARRLIQEKAALGLQITANGLIDRRTEAYKNLSEKEKALLAAYEDGFSQEKRALKAIEQRAEKEKLVQQELGLTGVAVGGLATVLGKLGLDGLSEDFDEIKKKLALDFRKELESTKEEVVSIGAKGTEEAVKTYKENQKIIGQNQERIDQLQEKGKLTNEEKEELTQLSAETDRITAANEELIDSQKVSLDITYQHIGVAKKMGMALSAAGQMAKAAFDKVADPAVVLSFIGNALLKGNSQAVKLQKELTISAGAARELRTELAGAAIASGSNFITTEKLVKSFVEMSKYIGQSAHALGGEALKSATYLTEKMHLSADAAGQLVTLTRLTGRNTEETFKGMGKTLTKFNLTNKTAFSLKDIMNDIGNMSKATVLTLGKSPDALVKAAAAARKLGVSMEQLESIGESLLDFETSIEKELEAQLLTGNSLNLSRARELAMMGDMEGLAKEIGNQEAIKNAFATKNVIAQKAAAEALGMSREELAKMTYQQELNNMSAEAFKAKYGEVAYESAKAQSAQDKFKDLLAKSQDILANLLTPLLPIVELVGKLAASPLAAPILAAGIAMKALGGSISGTIKGMGSLVGQFQKLRKTGFIESAKQQGAAIKDKALGLRDKAKSLFKEGKTGVKDKVETVKNKVTSSAKTLSDKAKKMPKDTKAGSGGFKALTDAISKIDVKKLLAGAAAMVVAAGAVFVFAKATQEFMQVSWGAVGKAIISLAALVGAVAALGVIMSSGVGAVAILAGAGAMVIMAGALFILGKAMQEIGEGLGIVGESVVDIGSAVSGEMIGKLFLLGPALMSAAAGIALFSAAMAGGSIVTGLTSLFTGGGILGDLQSLADMAQPLATVGTSLTLIASGLAAISLALSSLETEKINELKGLVMTTAMAAPMVAATGAITDLISGMTGGGEDNSNSELLAEIKALRAAVEAGGDVYIDGNKAGTAMMLAQYKTA